MIKPNRPALKVILLLLSFFLAVVLRIAIGGIGVSHSVVAGLIFAVVLIALSVAAGVSTKINFRIILVGCIGAAVMLLPSIFKSGGFDNTLPAGNYGDWAVVVALVALAEEVFLRGALFDAITKWRGPKTAVIIGALLFTILHIPLYGWYVIPLDFIVGIWLGALRIKSKSWVAPGLAHIIADLVSWWLI
jgi:membrane protease YdiL (CAAX protease family)